MRLHPTPQRARDKKWMLMLSLKWPRPSLAAEKRRYMAMTEEEKRRIIEMLDRLHANERRGKFQ